MGQLWCNTNHPYFVIGWSSHSYWWLSQSQCNETVTVLDKFVGFQPHCISDTSMSICQAVGSGFCCIRSSSCLAAGLQAKLGLRTMLEDVVTMPNELRVHDAFLFETFSGLDMYVAIPAGAGHGQ